MGLLKQYGYIKVEQHKDESGSVFDNIYSLTAKDVKEELRNPGVLFEDRRKAMKEIMAVDELRKGLKGGF